MNTNDKITRRMLSVIRENKGETPKSLITEEQGADKSFPITKTTPIFGEVGESMKSDIIQTVGELVSFDEKALIYSTSENGLTLTGAIKELNLDFQFKSSGCTIKIDGLTLTEDTYRKIGKLMSAYNSWKEKQAQDGDLLIKLQQYAERV